MDREADGPWQVHTGAGEALTADEVILATDAGAAARILGASPAATSGDPRLAAVAAEPRTGPPYAVARYWLDGDVDPVRAQFTSIADPGLLDSVTLYHRFEPARGNGTSAPEDQWPNCTPTPAHPASARLTSGPQMLAELRVLWPEVPA